MYVRRLFLPLRWYGVFGMEQVIGFVGGTVGLFERAHIEITDDVLDAYRNQVKELWMTF